MEGVAERERRRMEQIVLQAWWTANLTGAGEKLKPARHYLDQLKPKKPQTAEDVLAVFREHEARAPGAFRIKHFGPDGKELN